MYDNPFPIESKVFKTAVQNGVYVPVKKKNKNVDIIIYCTLLTYVIYTLSKKAKEYIFSNTKSN